ncbi:MAG: hypothetical protein KR126chlam3_01637 [Chlamydiae bacterium]|nr:hypothetical protein [Chlamydiota bacterium]
MSLIDPYQKIANQIYHEMTGKSDDVHVRIITETSYAAALPEKTTLLLHPLALLGPEDLPKDLQVEGPDDSKLHSDKYFFRLKVWLTETFGMDPSTLCNLREFFDVHLRTWKNPQMIDRIKRFAIAHEIGHIFHRHIPGNWDRFYSFSVSLVMVIFLFAFFPFYLAAILSILVIDVSKRAFKALREYSEQYQEKEADFSAVQLTKDLPAAKAFFHALDESHKHQWDQNSWLEKFLRILLLPETCFHISHPSPQARIQYLQNAQVKV